MRLSRAILLGRVRTLAERKTNALRPFLLTAFLRLRHRHRRSSRQTRRRRPGPGHRCKHPRGTLVRARRRSSSAALELPTPPPFGVLPNPNITTALHLSSNQLRPRGRNLHVWLLARKYVLTPHPHCAFAQLAPNLSSGYTVRSLSGLINESGLVRRSELQYAHEAYELYRDNDDVESDEAVAFRAAHGDRVPIKLLACTYRSPVLSVARSTGPPHRPCLTSILPLLCAPGFDTVGKASCAYFYYGQRARLRQFSDVLLFRRLAWSSLSCIRASLKLRRQPLRLP